MRIFNVTMLKAIVKTYERREVFTEHVYECCRKIWFYGTKEE